MSVVIGGGRGLIGKALAKSLRQSGYKVRIISRSSDLAKDIISWEDVKRNGLPPCETVINMSGKNIGEFNPALLLSSSKFEQYKNEFYTSRISTTNLLTDAAKSMDKPPSSFICASAIGYYEPNNDKIFTEDSPGGDWDPFFGPMCKDWENAARIPDAPQIRTVSLRIGLVLSRDGGLLKNMEPAFFLGLGGRLGSGQQWMPWIHIDDMVSLCRFVMDNRISGPINACVPEPCRNIDFVKALGAAMGRPAVLPVPEFMVRAMFGSERAVMFLQGGKILPKRALELGFKFKYTDLHDALKSLY